MCNLIGGAVGAVNEYTDLNLPICALNAILIVLLLRLKTPPATLREKLEKMDIM